MIQTIQIIAIFFSVLGLLGSSMGLSGVVLRNDRLFEVGITLGIVGVIGLVLDLLAIVVAIVIGSL